MTRKTLGPRTLGLMVGFVLALTLAGLPGARADDIDQATQLTFNLPVQLPGNVILSEGSYWFVVPDNNTKLVQVFDEDRLQVIATIPTVDVVRSGATNDTQLTFAAMGREPLALVSWFYPGRLTGHEFLYSDQMEKRLSGANMITVTGNQVPFTPGG